MSNVVERFLRYVKIDTQSVEADTVPSTQKQHDLASLLAAELEQMGASDVIYDKEHCYVYATIPATASGLQPTVGFIAHMDTSDSISGKDVKPRLIYDYDGKDIVLNQELGIVMKTSDYPHMLDHIGKTMIVTDGTTLLGADDKAGVAEIMAMAEYLLNNKQIEHGTIKLAFTPDEEVGNGTAYFDIKGFGAEFAYTVDGGAVGELEYENFNAAAVRVKIQGNSIHPGSAKGKMINALLVGMELQSLLPVFENPAYTEGYEGFYHLTDMAGGVEEAVMNYIIRDHDIDKFTAKKERFGKCVAYLNDKYGAGTVDAQITDSYFNMAEKIKPHMHLIENAKKAMRNLCIEPHVSPIRGGTDGARLSYEGLPCPNLCTGGYNYHGKFEYITAEGLEQVTSLLIELVRNGD